MTEQMDLNFEAARAAGDLGVERAAGRAERCEPGWIDRAAEALRIYATRHARLSDEPSEFTIERARTFMCASISKPPDGRAWGAATRRAVRLQFLERIPGAFEPAASSNGSPKPLYRRGKGA